MEISRVGEPEDLHFMTITDMCLLRLYIPCDCSDQWFELSGLASVSSVQVIELGCFHNIIKALAICYPQCSGLSVLVIKGALEMCFKFRRNKSISGRCSGLPHDHDQSGLNKWLDTKKQKVVLVHQWYLFDELLYLTSEINKP